MQANESFKAQEHMLLDRLASETLDARAYERWTSVRSSHRFLVHAGKRIIAFRLSGSTPVTLDTFECKSIAVSFKAGFTSSWQARNNPARTFTLGQAPVEVADACFMGHTMMTGAEYVEYAQGKFGLMVSMFYKTISNPQSLRQGPVYLLEEPAFHRQFSA